MTTEQKQQLIATINQSLDIDLLRKTRQRRVVDVRHALSFSLRRRKYTTIEIGEMIGKNHATIIHAERKVKNLYLTDRSFTMLVDAIENIIDNFFKKNKIHTHAEHIEKYNSLRVTAAKLIKRASEWMTEDELKYWTNEMDLSEKEYELFTCKTF
jgi:hypothetical protein